MSKNDMLAPIVRALVGIPQERLGVLFDAINKVGSADGELWRIRFADVLREGVKPAILSPELSFDTFIHVDRSIRLVYPDWVKTVMHLEIEHTGPVEYDLTSVALWLHDSQKNGRFMEGNKLYEYLKEEKMLESCLSLHDGEEIQKKGIAVFRKFFQGNVVFLWKSVVQSRRGLLSVPSLYESDGKVVMDWHWFGNDWNDDNPALRFAS
ncbi:MAG: hypothetical protein KC736_00005 [Candidatus Moranbacteria bacterium]|nr:hypothetical protein [Candidatus Moranbacteria bacterium]